MENLKIKWVLLFLVHILFSREKKRSNVMSFKIKSEKFNSLFDKNFYKKCVGTHKHVFSRIFFHLKKKMKNEDVWGCSIVSGNNKMEVRRQLRDKTGSANMRARSSPTCMRPVRIKNSIQIKSYMNGYGSEKLYFFRVGYDFDIHTSLYPSVGWHFA